jgi:hypothetical protein
VLASWSGSFSSRWLKSEGMRFRAAFYLYSLVAKIQACANARILQMSKAPETQPGVLRDSNRSLLEGEIRIEGRAECAWSGSRKRSRTR